MIKSAIALSVVSIVGVLALIWVFVGNDFMLYKVFAPKQEAVRREVFEQSKAYNQGMIQELQNMQFEYAKATKAQQDAMASIILHRVADFDRTKLPSDLLSFVIKLEQERINAR